MIEQASSRIALRLVVDGPADVADGTWIQVRDAIADLAAIDKVTIKPYWKFPGSQEVSSTLRPIGGLDHVYETVARRLGSGWTESADDPFARWTVWNRGHGEFIDSSVRWAHIELIRG
jgi:hypothetical protein